MLRLGVFKTSLKKNERRVPIYPEHLPWLPDEIRQSLLFEQGYADDYGFTDDYVTAHSGGVVTRSQLFEKCDVLMLPKPIESDLSQMRENQVLWGWVHCVQQRDITQIAIDRHLTLIAWEAMHHWSSEGEKRLHILYKNNEIAGYAAVLNALQILGIDGHYGPRKRVVVISYGSVSRGAIYGLQGRGFNNIHVFTQRPVHLVADQNPDVYYGQMSCDKDGVLYARQMSGSKRPFIDELAEADIICNGILQDTDNPLMFVDESQLHRLKPRSIIIDISCDKGLGFSFARPTTFSDPTFIVGDNVTYYSVDHTPSYLWNAASREISRALIPYLPAIVGGRDGWYADATLRRAIETEDGLVKNKKILTFQRRAEQYPHSLL